jgi:hypothetical protein
MNGPAQQAAWAETFAPVLQELRMYLWRLQPQPLAAAAGAVWLAERGELRLCCLGEELCLPWETLVAHPVAAAVPCKADLQGLLLYYLSRADGTLPAGRWIAFRELPDGWFYHQAFQGYTGHYLTQAVGNDLERLDRAARQLGGQPLDIGDVGYTFDGLPRVPLALVYWQGDEEFPPQAQVLFDAATGHYLPIDGFAMLGRRLVHCLL